MPVDSQRSRALLVIATAACWIAAGWAAGCGPNETSTSEAGPSEIDPGAEPAVSTRGEASVEALVQGALATDAPFVDVAAAAGLHFMHDNGMTGRLSMAEVIGPGAALLDYDGDGDLDAYLVQGGPLDGSEPRPTDRLFRNEWISDPATGPGGARLRFTDVTDELGLRAPGYGIGVAAGDYDNDGDLDLYLTNFGANQLLENLGDRFIDVTVEAGPEVGDARLSVPALFFDYDGDGWLDLYVGNYVDAPAQPDENCRDATGVPDYCGPSAFAAQADRLLRNRRDGTFEDVTARAGLAAAAAAPALGALAADFDDDGWLDLYVANDQTPNHLWRNRGDGTFEEAAMLAGAAVNGRGKSEASMGVDAADVDDDGDLDLFLTHVLTESNTLYRNDGGGLFMDATDGSGLGPPSRLHTAFGTGFLDVDLDGQLDLLVLNGAVRQDPAQRAAGDPFPLHEANQLFRGLGGGRFEPLAAGDGPLALSEVSRAAAFGDVDNDGDVDVLVTQARGPARLLLNPRRPTRWLGVRALAGTPPRDQPGARVALLSDGVARRWQRVRTDGSYAAASDPRIPFVLQPGEAISGLRVRWPDGQLEDWPTPALGKYLGQYNELRRGGGQVPGVAQESDP